MPESEKITGIILAGGKSSRMGQDKGLLSLKGKRLIDIALSKLQAICDEILISSASADYANLGYRTIADEISEIGPMGGIYSSLKASSHPKNLILSIDMPFISEELISYILQNSDESQITAPWEGEDFFQPLCAYYNKSVLPYMDEMIKKGNYKLIDLFAGVSFHPLKIDRSLSFFKTCLFLNVNRPDDLRIAESLME